MILLLIIKNKAIINRNNYMFKAYGILMMKPFGIVKMQNLCMAAFVYLLLGIVSTTWGEEAATRALESWFWVQF